MALEQVLAAKRDDIVIRWMAQVRGTLAPEGMPPLELVDHIPEFLDEIASALQSDQGGPSLPSWRDTSVSAAGHGAQRLRLGFSLDSVVREYAALAEAVIDSAQSTGTRPTHREVQVLFGTTIAGIAQAVTEYTRQRDTQLLKQANEHFAFMAHELRNPLSSAMLAFNLLRSKAQLPAESRSVAALERGLARTNELIDQTLQSARVVSGIDLHKQPTTLEALFDDVELGASSEAESKNVKIRSTIDSDASICVDPRLVRSALANLLRNAVKYTHAGSLVELRGTIASGRALIEVEDCCGGLEPGKAERAFAPFVRLDNRESGFGLGLAIAKQAVDSHGGTIRVQNLPGKGCIFVLELPIDSA